jgi:hypothetical protein
MNTSNCCELVNFIQRRKNKSQIDLANWRGTNNEIMRWGKLSVISADMCDFSMRESQVENLGRGQRYAQGVFSSVQQPHRKHINTNSWKLFMEIYSIHVVFEENIYGWTIGGLFVCTNSWKRKPYEVVTPLRVLYVARAHQASSTEFFEESICNTHRMSFTYRNTFRKTKQKVPRYTLRKIHHTSVCINCIDVKSCLSEQLFSIANVYYLLKNSSACNGCEANAKL